MKKALSIILLLLLLFAGCAKNKTSISTEQKLSKADDFFARKKYHRAVQLYEDIAFERKSAQTAHALMRQADCYFAMNKFVDAKLKYQQFIQMFPDHLEVNKAYYQMGVALYESSLPAAYDQSESLEAIDTFKLFIEKFPNDSRYSTAVEYIRKAQYKQLEKKLNNGYIYYKMKDYSAALMYFKEITELGNEDHLDRKALYYSALVHIHQNNPQEARLVYDQLKQKYPGAKETSKIARKLK